MSLASDLDDEFQLNSRLVAKRRKTAFTSSWLKLLALFEGHTRYDGPSPFAFSISATRIERNLEVEKNGTTVSSLVSQ